MQFTSETAIDGVLERLFDLNVGDERIPGVIWSPIAAFGRRPVVLMGHGGSQHKQTPGLVSRAHKYVTDFGFAVVAIDAPSHGARPQSEHTKQFVAEMRQRFAEGKPVGEVVAREMAEQAMKAVPEWQATLNAVQALDFVGADGPVGYWGVSLGGAIGVPFVAAEPRITAAFFGMTGLLPGNEPLAKAAARITIPVEFVVQWDDKLVSQESAFALFDAFGSQEKTLHANSGGHTKIPAFDLESWERFFARHLQM